MLIITSLFLLHFRKTLLLQLHVYVLELVVACFIIVPIYSEWFHFFLLQDHFEIFCRIISVKTIQFSVFIYFCHVSFQIILIFSTKMKNSVFLRQNVIHFDLEKSFEICWKFSSSMSKFKIVMFINLRIEHFQKWYPILITTIILFYFINWKFSISFNSYKIFGASAYSWENFILTILFVKVCLQFDFKKISRFCCIELELTSTKY